MPVARVLVKTARKMFFIQSERVQQCRSGFGSAGRTRITSACMSPHKFGAACESSLQNQLRAERNMRFRAHFTQQKTTGKRRKAEKLHVQRFLKPRSQHASARLELFVQVVFPLLGFGPSCTEPNVCLGNLCILVVWTQWNQLACMQPVQENQYGLTNLALRNSGAKLFKQQSWSESPLRVALLN